MARRRSRGPRGPPRAGRSGRYLQMACDCPGSGADAVRGPGVAPRPERAGGREWFRQDNPGRHRERFHELSHGEGFLEILRTRVNHDRMCRRLADGSGAAVLAIGYRLAPEDPWPASVDDPVAALRWVASAPAELGEAPGAVAVAGDSAGGPLAARGCPPPRAENPHGR